MHVAPNGKVFCARPSQATRYLNVSGTGSWDFGREQQLWHAQLGQLSPLRQGQSAAGRRNNGRPLHGGSAPTATAEIIDLNGSTPTWTYTGSLSGPRKLHNATLLPDGKVLITGGSQGGEDPNTKPAKPAYTSEMWDPATGTWTTMASITVIRAYHMRSLFYCPTVVFCQREVIREELRQKSIRHLIFLMVRGLRFHRRPAVLAMGRCSLLAHQTPQASPR